MYKMNEPLVSVIMGIYNCEDTLERAVESIVNQTYTNWELILCDDGSKDETFRIAEKIAQIDNRIIVIRNEENKGLAYTLNHCLEHVKGEYVARMDSDDVSLPTRIDEQVKYLESHREVDLVGSQRIIFDEKCEYGIRGCIEYPNRNSLIKGSPFAHPTVMLKKTVYDSLNGYTVSKATRRAEDLDLWFRFFEAGYIGHNIQKPLLKYHESPGDLKKRSISAGFGTAKVMLSGYRRLHIPIFYYAFALKPIITSILPNRLMMNYHQKKLHKE